MDRKDILSKVDHTLLAQGATWEHIKVICDDAIKYGTASVCIPPSFVKQVAEYIGDYPRRIACDNMNGGDRENDSDAVVNTGGELRLPKVCTVIGFPNGYATTAAKVFETEDAILNGADEIDMVINIGWAKADMWEKIEEEIKAIKSACGDKVLKVIIETCLLENSEKKEMCRVVTSAGADYIKTSTGFVGGGATFDDVKLFKENVGAGVKIKAAGGISSFEDAEKFIELGADRLGTSRLVKLMKN